MSETPQQPVTPQGKGNASSAPHISVKDEINVGATTLVAEKRWAKILFRGISVCTTLFLVGSFSQQVYSHFQKPRATDPSICVFLPDPARSPDGSFYQDGVVQKRGFDKAVQDADKLPNRLKVDFQYMKREETPEELLKRMRECYQGSGATFFIMTMSSKTGDLHEHFKRWHDECHRRGGREPVLIATVASAPDIADASGGILRWYIRSEEESALLAEYLRWKEAVTHVGVFYITRNAGQADDRYGNRGMQEFHDRFISGLGGSSIDDYSTTAGTAKSKVATFLAKNQSNTKQAPNVVGAFIVGYGDMVREVLAELISQGFAGPIACASTLTEPDWQPQGTNADKRIFTVLPRMSDPRTKLQKDDRNVVFFFSKQTLFRVLELTAKDSDSRTFVDRWIKSGINTQLAQECLENGDILVQLDVAGCDQWR